MEREEVAQIHFMLKNTTISLIVVVHLMNAMQAQKEVNCNITDVWDQSQDGNDENLSLRNQKKLK